MKKINPKRFLINYFSMILVNFLFADSNIIILLVGTFFSLVFPFVANLHKFLEKCQSFPLQLSAINESLLTNTHNNFFDRKNICANVYILQSHVLGYMEGIKEKV